jgi:glyceraldehyde-3-phosphate dehydrogenase/erythrose-4-phosphate dehydrogenase
MLYAVADKMRQCPENKLVLNGPGGKSSKYNAASNTRCMEEIVKFLNEKFGISRDRIITNYNAGTESKNTIELIIK